MFESGKPQLTENQGMQPIISAILGFAVGLLIFGIVVIVPCLGIIIFCRYRRGIFRQPLREDNDKLELSQINKAFTSTSICQIPPPSAKSILEEYNTRFEKLWTKSGKLGQGNDSCQINLFDLLYTFNFYLP